MSPRSVRRAIGTLLAALPLLVGGCGETATGPKVPAVEGIFILNSTGQTLASFDVSAGLEVSGSPVDLGAGFDGEAFDLSSGFAVTTVSSFGGSRILFVDLATGGRLTSRFPAPETDLANPSAASFDGGGTVWVGGRGSDAVYRAGPGDAVAERIAENVGTFIEQVIPVGDLLYVLDANIDDAGGSYRPLGPGRVVVLSRSGVEQAVLDLPAGALNPTEAVVVGETLVVLAAGSFDESSFLPANDGSIVSIDLATGEAGPPLALGSNGVSLELGEDGHVYVTTTSDYAALRLLRFDPVLGSFARGPANPIDIRDPDGASVNCWTATALEDGRIICATFSFVEAGRLVLADAAGGFIDEVPSGFGTTDVATR